MSSTSFAHWARVSRNLRRLVLIHHLLALIVSELYTVAN